MGMPDTKHQTTLDGAFSLFMADTECCNCMRQVQIGPVVGYTSTCKAASHRAQTQTGVNNILTH